MELRSKEGKAKIITFRRLLLTRVQQEFENKKGDKEKESILKTIKGTHNVSQLRSNPHQGVDFTSGLQCSHD